MQGVCANRLGRGRKHRGWYRKRHRVENFFQRAKPMRRFATAQQGAAQLLECLGSTELETLVGKLFEAKGCHVPAYLGGTLRDIDLFAYNDTATPISIDAITIPPSDRISVQVKTWTEDECPAGVDYFIALNAKTGGNSFDADWLLARVKECPPVLQWMKRSLRWGLPWEPSQNGNQP